VEPVSLLMVASFLSCMRWATTPPLHKLHMPTWWSTTHVKLYLAIEHDQSYVSELASEIHDLNQNWRMNNASGRHCRMLVPTPCCSPCNLPHLKHLWVLPPHILSAGRHAHRIVCKFEVGSKGVEGKTLNLFVEPALVIIEEVDVCLCDTIQCWPISSLASQEMESGHSVTKTHGPPDGHFTFTHEVGDHSISASPRITQCHTSSSTSTSTLVMSNPTLNVTRAMYLSWRARSVRWTRGWPLEDGEPLVRDLKFHSMCFLSWLLPCTPVPLPHSQFPDGACHEALCIVEHGLDGDMQLGEFFYCNRRTCQGDSS